MQFARAPTQGVGEQQIERMHAIAGFPHRLRLLHAIVQEPFQVILGVGPGVALIADKALQHRQRNDITVLVFVLQGTGQRRGVTEIGDVGQESTHLQLGIDAGPQPSIALEQHPVADIERGIAAIQRQPLDRQHLRQVAGQAVEDTGRGKFQPAATQRYPGVARHHLQHGLREFLIGVGVVQQAHPGTDPDARQRVGPQRAQFLLAIVFPGQRHR